MYVSILALPLAVSYIVYSYKKMTTDKIRNITNNGYSRHFPILDISTVGCEHFIGKLVNVFDDKAIRLLIKNKEVIILWDAVATIMEAEEGIQKEISDF
jgi:hypothetical protein